MNSLHEPIRPKSFVFFFIIGAAIAVYLASGDLKADNYYDLFDAALQHLEAGLPL